MSKQEQKKYPKFLFSILDVQYLDRFNSRQFGAYQDINGKTIYLINGNGQQVESGYTTSQINHLFDVSRIENSEIVKFLIGHPSNIDNGGQEFSLIDIEKASENKDDNLIAELELEAQIINLDLRRLKATASALGIAYDSKKKNIQASIIRRIRTPQLNAGKITPGYISVKSIVESKKTLILLDIQQMIDYDLISINQSGIYVHGNHNLGLNADQVVVYFDRDKPLYSLLKTELRKLLLESGNLDDGKDNLDLKL